MMLRHTSIWLLGLLCAINLPASDDELVRLAEGIYLSPGRADGGAVSNSGIVMLESSILVFDSHYTPEAASRLIEHVRKISRLPIRYLVNSHHHADHTHGNQAFQGVQHTVASTAARADILEKDLPALLRVQAIAERQIEQIRRELRQQTDERARARLQDQIRSREENLARMQKLRIVAPALTFDDRLMIVERNREIHLIHLGRGHTAGDIIMFLPRERIVFAGDLFFNRALPNTDDAQILEWVRAIPEMLKLEADIFVPGHGAAGTRQDVELFLQYLLELKQIVEDAMSTQESLEQLLRHVRIPAPYESFSFQNFFPGNVQRMYSELKATQVHAPPAGSGGGMPARGQKAGRP